MTLALLEIESLTAVLHQERGEFRAVDGLTLSLDAGETVCLVGESGSGKSMAALSVMRLIEMEATARIHGVVRFRGEDLFTKSQREMRGIRGRGIAMVFQEPMTALNPVQSIGRQLRQVIRYHSDENKAVTHRGKKGIGPLVQALAEVGIPEPESALSRYPHQLSGGMRQRVMIAMALLGSPDLLIADEPTTALDVTTQAQILELLFDLQARTGMAVLLITHDMAVASQVADRVAVMYAGRLIEESPAEVLFKNPGHPYTKGLLASVPSMSGARRERLRSIPGSVPDLDRLPAGCRFAPRCERATQICHDSDPVLAPVDQRTRVACWHPYSTDAVR